jgi:hypothetical protein
MVRSRPERLAHDRKFNAAGGNLNLGSRFFFDCDRALSRFETSPPHATFMPINPDDRRTSQVHVIQGVVAKMICVDSIGTACALTPFARKRKK